MIDHVFLLFLLLLIVIIRGCGGVGVWRGGGGVRYLKHVLKQLRRQTAMENGA